FMPRSLLTRPVRTTTRSSSVMSPHRLWNLDAPPPMSVLRANCPISEFRWAKIRTSKWRSYSQGVRDGLEQFHDRFSILEETASITDAGGVAAFPALTRDMQCVLVGLRSKTSLNSYAQGERPISGSRPWSWSRDVRYAAGKRPLQAFCIHKIVIVEARNTELAVL